MWVWGFLSSKLKQTLTFQSFCVILAFQGFEMQTFAASVFAKLRRSLDITEDEYTNSLCSDGCYLQFVSNSKSKADFFVTWAWSFIPHINILTCICFMYRMSSIGIGWFCISSFTSNSNIQCQCSVAVGLVHCWVCAVTPSDMGLVPCVVPPLINTVIHPMLSKKS